jgi:GAF domain-containing protein
MVVDKQQQYDALFQRIDCLCDGEADPIALMATIACEVYHAFEQFDWVGFYRNVGGDMLKIGPYQGTHGCLAIPFARGICGQCAREQRLLNIPDVSKVPHHIACASTTRSELVLPILDAEGSLITVFDVDSDDLAAFDAIDETNLARVADYFKH